MNGVFDRWLKNGFDKNAVHNFQQWLLKIPGEWEVIKNETVNDRRERRKKLAYRIKQLADEINSDADARLIRLYDEKSIITGAMPDKPFVSDFLFDFAEHIDTLAISEYREQCETARPAKKSPKTPDVVRYAMRRVLEMLVAMDLPVHERNKDTATLVNGLFSLSGDKKVMTNDVAKIPNIKRRGYCV